MTKKGQISFLVLLGIMILFSASVYWFLVVNTQRQIPTPINVENVRICTEEVLDELLYDAAFQGGYARLPAETFPTVFGSIPMYKVIPKKEEFQRMLEQGAQERLALCTLDVPNIKNEEGIIDVQITLSAADTRIAVTYPSVFVEGGKEQRVPPLSVHSSARFLALYNVVEQLTQLIKKDPLLIPSSELLDIEEKEHVDIDALWDETHVIYFITDKMPGALPITWTFAVKA